MLARVLTLTRRTPFPLYRLGNSSGPRLRKKDIRIGRDLVLFESNGEQVVSPFDGKGMSVFSTPRNGSYLWKLPSGIRFPEELDLLDDTQLIHSHYLIAPAWQMSFELFADVLEQFGTAPPWERITSLPISLRDPQVPGNNAGPPVLLEACLSYLQDLKAKYKAEEEEDNRIILEEDINKLELVLQYWPSHPHHSTTPLFTSYPLFKSASIVPVVSGKAPCKCYASAIVVDAIIHYRNKLVSYLPTTLCEDKCAEIQEDINKLDLMVEQMRNLISKNEMFNPFITHTSFK